MQVNINNILITTGSQQALDLHGENIHQPGDRILVESPTYLGALQAWNAYGAEYISVPVDEYGMRTIYLKMHCAPVQIHLRFTQLSKPNGNNPALRTAHEIIELADRYGCPIIETIPMVNCEYEGEDIPSVEILDSRMREQNGTTPECNLSEHFFKDPRPGIASGMGGCPG